jgi:nucleoid-associated protein YgaU
MASTIGIKVADGEFYPIIEENSSAAKRLVLTTAHDNQKSVQIDVYSSSSKAMADALYVGSLVVEGLEPGPKGEASIEMILATDALGRIAAEAADLNAPEGVPRQYLSVSLSSVEEGGLGLDGEPPDFELDFIEHPPQGLYDKNVSKEPEEARGSPRGRAKGPIVALAGALVLVLGVLYFFFLNDAGVAIRSRLRPGPAASAPAEPAPASAPAAAVPAAATPVDPAPLPAPAVPVISAAQQPPRAADPENARADRTRTLPPVASYKVPQTIPKAGAPYTIRWGDTLWDIAEAFYRNPWQYSRIARFNGIRNPDRIISGTTIRIPPRN